MISRIWTSKTKNLSSIKAHLHRLRISSKSRETQTTGNFRMTAIDLRPKMSVQDLVSIQGIKQFTTWMGSPGKTSHSDQARAVSIGATRPGAMRTITTNKKLLFCTYCFDCLFYCLNWWVNCSIINVSLKLRPHTSVHAQRTIVSVFPCSGPS